MARDNGGVIGVLNTPTSTTASGVWALQDQYEAKRNGTWPLIPFVSPNSLRFNSASSDYLSRTPASAGSRTTWTWSGWVKRSKLSVGSGSFGLFGCNPSGNEDILRFDNNTGNLNFYVYTGGYVGQLNSTQYSRDVSAWYHLVFVWDTTNATSTDRMRMYVNGSRVTAFDTATYPSLNAVSNINNNVLTDIGWYRPSAGGYFDGYMSEIYFIDGQALTPSSFGASNASGVWYPIPYSGSYGTNGFYLKFGNASSLGTDSSPNGNNWTVNNLTSVDQSTDSTLNNFATMNPLFIPTTGTATFTEGNLQLSLDANDYGLISTVGVNKGKWYWEVKWTADSGFDRVGIKLNANPDQNPALSGIGWNRLSTTNGMYMLDSAVSGSWGSAFSVNDIISFALDCDNKALYIAQNGTWRNSGVPTSGASKTGAVDYSAQSTLTSDYLFPAVGKGNVGTTGFQFNFGSPMYSANGYADGNGYGNFSYAVPSGYYALCTANLNTYG